MPSVRVLVLDDHRDAMEAMVALVELIGYEAKGCTTGIECLGIATVWRPRIVLLDLSLPVMSGFEVAQRIRGIEGLESAALIAWTCLGSDLDREKTRLAGFVEHLVKPVEATRLREALGAIASQS
jgi:CheY-like chemotaxis protein